MATLTTTIEDEHYNHQQNRASHQRNAKIHPEKLSLFSSFKHLSKIQEEPSDTIFQVTIFPSFLLVS